MEKYKKITLTAVIIAGLIILLAVYFLFMQKKESGSEDTGIRSPQKTQQAQTATEKDKPEPKVEEKIPQFAYPPVTGELNQSDEQVMTILKDISQHSLIDTLTTQRGLIRLFVAVVDNIAHGKSPKANLPFFDLSRPFRVIKQGEKVWIDPKGYQRYNDLVNLYLSIDSKKAQAFYKSAEALINQAYQELGYGEEDFKETLLQAAKRIIKTPQLEGRIYVREKVTTYEFQNPGLEKLDDFSRQLLRIGPDNIAKVKKKTKELISLIWDQTKEGD